MDLKIRYEKCLINLKIVSKLYQHERLRFGHEHVMIMPYSFLSGWIRYFSGENRNDIIIGLNNMFNEIETICDEFRKDTKSRHKIIGISREIEQLYKENDRALLALLLTYQYDSTTYSKLEVIIDKFKHLVIILESILIEDLNINIS